VEVAGVQVTVLDDWEGRWRAAPVLSRLQAAGLQVRILGEERPWTEVLPEAAGAEILVLNRERTRLDAARIAQLPRLRMIAQTGTGVPHLDLPALRARGIPVGVTPAASAPAVAELALGLMLAATRQVIGLHLALRGGGWPRPITAGLGGRRLGIVGLGEIGREVARLAMAFGMEVLAWGPTLSRERAAAAGVDLAPSLEDLCTRADVVSLHLRVVPATRGLLTEALLERIGPDGLLVNTARAELVDMAAVRRVLADGRLGGAALDVFDREPLAADDPLRTSPRAILSPHVGWMTDGTWDAFIGRSVDNILAFLRGEGLPAVK
jgi:D-3-phosphoglycerate dehydrogenase